MTFILKPTRIIVQDPDPDIRAILKIALEQENFDVLTASDPNTIVDLISSFSPDLVMLDFRFTGQRSMEVCQTVKSRYPGLPVVAFSCNADIDQVYAREGFDDYIKKPFDLDLLYGVLRKHLN